MTAAAAVTHSGEPPHGDMTADWWSFYSNRQCSLIGEFSKQLDDRFWNFFSSIEGGNIPSEQVSEFREHLLKVQSLIWEKSDDDFLTGEYLAYYPDDLSFECPSDRLGHLVKKTLYMNVSALILLCSVALERGEAICLVGD